MTAQDLIKDWRVLAGAAVVVVLALAAVLVAGGGGERPEPTTTTQAVTTTTVAQTTTTTTSSSTTTLAALTWPLTGEPVGEDASGFDRRVLVVKVDNSAAARPQAGLVEADLVIELAVEGGVTRLLAFYQSADPERVVPVRSVREVDPKLVAPFDALVAHSGGVPAVLSALGEVAVDLGHGVLGDVAYRRDPSRPALYDLTVDPAALREVAPAWHGQVPRPLTFDEVAPDGDPATEVSVPASPRQRVTYRYSAVEGGYLRFHGETSHEDASGRQLAADTVVVLEVERVETGRTDAAGAPVPDYQVLGTGRAWLFREGVGVTGRWERGRLQDFFRFFDDRGEPVGLAPGRTWIHLVVPGSTVESS